MLNQLIRQVALGILVKAAREQNPDLARYFWDLKYLYEFGLEPPPEAVPDIPFPPGPQPDPVPFRQLGIHAEVLFGLADLVADQAVAGTGAGDPSPQPNLGFVLTNPDPRLDAAKHVQQRLKKAVGHLEEEIHRLEKAAG